MQNQLETNNFLGSGWNQAKRLKELTANAIMQQSLIQSLNLTTRGGGRGGYRYIKAQLEDKTLTGTGLKGTVPRDFRLLFFSWISFPQAPVYTIRAVSNLLENSRWHSHFCVHRRCRWLRRQMEQISNQKNFNCFVWTPLGSRVNI